MRRPSASAGRIRPYRRVVLLLTARERDVFRQAYGQADDHTWARARGWALSLSLVFMAFSADNPLMAGIGQRTLREVLI